VLMNSYFVYFDRDRSCWDHHLATFVDFWMAIAVWNLQRRQFGIGFTTYNQAPDALNPNGVQ
jgi:hypothetical protein